MTSASGSPPSLMEIFALHASVDVALKTGLLEHLAASPSTAREAAAALRLHARGVELVLDVLRTAGLTEAAGDAHRLTPALVRELRGPDPRAEGRLWNAAAAFVTQGRTLESAAERETTYAAVVNGLGALFAEAAGTFSRSLAPALPAGAHILDVGSGSGVWSLSVLEQRPDVRATGLDLAEVMPRFEAAARARGMSERVECLVGDYLSVDPPDESYDAVIFANVLHLEPPQRARQLLQRFAPATQPGGKLAIIDAFPAEEPAARRRCAAYALHLALRLPGARPHPEPEVRAWLAETGFSVVDRLPLEDEVPLMTALVATR